jgi:hypothetical protein
MEEQKPNEQAEELGISEQDALLSIEILKKALEYRPQIQKAILASSWTLYRQMKEQTNYSRLESQFIMSV